MYKKLKSNVGEEVKKGYNEKKQKKSPQYKNTKNCMLFYQTTDKGKTVSTKKPKEENENDGNKKN